MFPLPSGLGFYHITVNTGKCLRDDTTMALSTEDDALHDAQIHGQPTVAAVL